MCGMSTVAEIESAIEKLPPPDQREVFDFIAGKLEAQEGGAAFPDLKALLLAFPDAGADADFARVRWMPGDLDLS